MFNKSGQLCHRDKFSRCQSCEYYISGFECWYYDYIPYVTWQNYDDPKEFNCDEYKSTIKQLNSHFIHKDYEDLELFPEKVFGGKYKFNKKGKIIGEL